MSSSVFFCTWYFRRRVVFNFSTFPTTTHCAICQVFCLMKIFLYYSEWFASPTYILLIRVRCFRPVTSDLFFDTIWSFVMYSRIQIRDTVILICRPRWSELLFSHASTLFGRFCSAGDSSAERKIEFSR